MKIIIPLVLAVNEASDRKDVIQQIKNPALILNGTMSRFTRGSLSGTLFQEEGSQNRILIVPPKARVGTIGSDIDSIISSAAEPKEELLDVSDGRWLRNSNLVIHGVSDNIADRTKSVLESWTGAFSYVEENVAENVPGLRKPQIGALHAVHAHWSVSNSPATVVMPTGTGKTETIRGLVGENDWPRYTEEEPEIYEQDELDKLFAECDADERLWYEFVEAAISSTIPLYWLQ